MPDLVETHLENRVIVQPDDANTHQTAHGGNVVRWMDEVGAMASMRFAGGACVTAHVDRVDFQRPIDVGDVALIEAYVYEAGETSIRVRLQAFREDPRAGDRQKTTESYFVYVAVDEEGQPVSVPDLTVGSDWGERLRTAALADEE
jgi:acyl-CoA hydrolase